MTDLYHFMGGDLVASANGDLLTASGEDEATQRILRRLLTNTQGYLWHLDFGAGLGAKVGSTIDVNEIRGLIRSQIFEESIVSRLPEPSIVVTEISQGVSVSIQYTDAVTKKVTALSFDATV